MKLKLFLFYFLLIITPKGNNANVNVLQILFESTVFEIRIISMDI